MPELETNILEWRKKMLSAGIKSPVPLDELEGHLRERVHDLKAGLSEADAFQTAAKELGDGRILKKEFSKGRFVWRVRTNPLALNFLGAWFILGGLNALSQFFWLWFADWPWEETTFRYVAFAWTDFFALQLLVGIGLLGRGRFWRYAALAFCAFSIFSTALDVANNLRMPDWAWPGHYFILMGVSVPTRYSLPVDFLNFSLLAWAIYVLAKSPRRNLFRPRAAN